MAKGNGKTIVLTKEQKTALRSAKDSFGGTIKDFCKKYNLSPPQLDNTLTIGRASEKTMRKLNKIFQASVA